MNVTEMFSAALPFPELYVTGFADMQGLLPGQYGEFPYAVSLARKLDDSIIDAIEKGPDKNYLDHYRAINAELTRVCETISLALSKQGVRNLVIKPTFQDEELDEAYFKTLRTPFSHKMAATRAGIGWIGKTALLVTEKFGPRVRLATVLVRERLCDTGTPVESGRCGACTVCVVKCPAQAANGREWDVRTDRDLFFDALKCRGTARELSMKYLNEEISLCGICSAVCPKGGKGKKK